MLKNVLKHFFFGFKTLLSELNFDAFTCNLAFGILFVWIGWGSIELAVGGPATRPQFQREGREKLSFSVVKPRETPTV